MSPHTRRPIRPVRPLQVLAVDDEGPALTQMSWLLEANPLVGKIFTAQNVPQAKHVLDTQKVDVVLLDIHMPGQSGLEMARELNQAAESLRVIFVTADAQPAVEAFELEVLDYLLKPVRSARLNEALRKAVVGLGLEAEDPTETGAEQATKTTETDTGRVSVYQGDTTVLVRISDIRWAQAQSDYARLHTNQASYLLRVSMAELEQQWAEHGFVRIHRSHVVNLNHAERIVQREGRMSIHIGGTDLPVSRRLMPHVRERLSALRIRTSRSAKTDTPGQGGGAPATPDASDKSAGLNQPRQSASQGNDAD